MKSTIRVPYKKVNEVNRQTNTRFVQQPKREWREYLFFLALPFRGIVILCEYFTKNDKNK